MTKAELRRLFDRVDDEVLALRCGGSKGWLAALRDSAALKTVRVWRNDEGWGVIDIDQTPVGAKRTSAASTSPATGSCTSASRPTGLGGRKADGYAFRTVRTWPADQQPVHPVIATQAPDSNSLTNA